MASTKPLKTAGVKVDMVVDEFLECCVVEYNLGKINCNEAS